jgi:hypothetical protein
MLVGAVIAVANGQTPTGFTSGQVLNASDLNTAFSRKQDFPLPTISLITGVTGTLGVGNGGTGQTSFTTNAVMLGNGTSPLSVVSGLGTAGQVLTSNGPGGPPTFQAGGGSSSITIGTTPITGGTIGNVLMHGTGPVVNEYGVSATSGTPTKLATVSTISAPTAGNCVQWDVNLGLTSAASACGTAGGSGTVNSGTAGQLAYYATTTNAVNGNANVTISTGTLTLGVAGSVQGSLALSGSTSGTTTFSAPASGGGTLILQAGSDTLVGRATTDTLTNKTYDTAGTGNSLAINGVAVTANTGTGAIARANSPTFTTPALGVATATTINKVTLTAPATGATLTIVDGKTLTANNSLTLSGTDGNSISFPSTVNGGGTVSYTIANGQLALATSAIASAACGTVQTITAGNAANVLTTDTITASFSADPTGTVGYQASTTGMLTIIAYPGSGSVNFKVCNNTSASITPGAVTINWRVVR